MVVKRTRNRLTKSCLECNRRKQKCDRKTPCQHCISRSVADRCSYQETKPKPPTSRERGESSDSDSFEMGESSELGYMEHGPGALQELDRTNFVSRPRKKHLDPSQNQQTIQRLLPKKSIVDSLIAIFFKDINRVYEMIYEPMFMYEYELWWSHDIGMNTDFALLILRLCILSLQSVKGFDRNFSILENKNLTEIINSVKLEQRLCRIAEDLESRRPRKHSLLVVHHMFFQVCYLKNRGQIKDSWLVLADTVREAHEIGLHLERPGVSELDQELWRRAFWNLYIWDRFMSTFLGRWPLIPEDNCDIDLPHDNIQAVTTSSSILTQYTDRLFQVHVARFLSHTMGSKEWKKDQYDHVTVAQNIQYLEENIIRQLPSAFSVTNPDKSWDIALPSLAVKRESLHMAIYSAVAGLYRAFANPWALAIKTTDTDDDNVGCDDLSISYYCSLMTELCKVLDSAMRLYDMRLSSQTEGFFMGPMSMVEALSQIGLCFRAAQSEQAAQWSIRKSEMARKIDHQLRFDVCETFSRAFRMLEDHRSESKIAKHGVHILSEIAAQIGSHYERELSIFIATQSHSYEQLAIDMSLHSENPSAYQTIEENEAFDWTHFMTSPDRYWFFEDLNLENTS